MRIRRLASPVDVLRQSSGGVEVPAITVATFDVIELPDEAAQAMLDRDPTGWEIVLDRGIVDVDQDPEKPPTEEDL